MPSDDPRCRTLAPATDAAEAIDPAVASPLATLLAGNVIPQGEIVQLMLKPSRWFVLLNSVRFAAFTVLILTAVSLPGLRFAVSKTLCVQFGFFLIVARVMWSTVEWMGRYYLLTDLRLIRVSGVFTIVIQSVPLRKVDAVNFYTTVGERLTGTGCIEMTNAERKMTWQTVARPRPVHRTVTGAVAKAKSNGCGAA